MHKKACLLYLTLLVLLGLVAYTYLGSLLYQGTLFVAGTSDQPVLADFLNHYNASLIAKHSLHERIDIYDPAVQDSFKKTFVAAQWQIKPFYLQYPPHFFTLALPLSYFTITGAWYLWTAVGVAALLSSLYWVMSPLNLSLLEKTIVTTAVLVSFPTWLSIRMGQTSLFNLAVIVIMLCLLKSKRPFLSGLAASLVTVKLQYAPIIIIVGCVAGGLPFLLGAAAGGLALAALAGLVLGIQNLLSYPQALLVGETTSSYFGVWPNRMQNVRGLITLLTNGNYELSLRVALAAFLFSLIAVVALWRIKPAAASALKAGQSSDESRLFRWQAALTMPILLLSSLHTHHYDYVLMIVSCIWIWQETGLLRACAPRLSALVRFLILVFPFASWIFANYLPAFWQACIQPFAVWAVCFLATSMLLFRRWRQSMAVSAI